MIDWEIKPLVGFGPLRFGMDQAEVTQRLGPPRSRNRTSATELTEYRGHGSRNFDVLLDYEDGALVGATFPFNQNDIQILGLPVYRADPADVVTALGHANGGSYAVYLNQYACFDALGITLSDFAASDASQTWIASASRTAFQRTVSRLGDPDEIVWVA